MAKTKIPAFQNETYKDYTQPRERKAMEAALRKTGDSLGKIYPNVIGGKRIGTSDAIASRNPARPSEIIGNFAKGTVRTRGTGASNCREGVPNLEQSSV